MDLYWREQLIRQREQELRRRAERYGSRMPSRARRSARSRAGWTLVEIGLALVSGSGDV